MRPLTIKNARLLRDFSPERSLNVERGDLHVAARVLDAPARGALAVDLSGYTIFPGLVNAHDHLELNHFPRTKFRERYDNAHQWGEDVNARLNDAPFRDLRAYPLWDKLFIGGLKNLLGGATTVAHHNTLYRPLKTHDFPVRVLQKYGWAHSLHFARPEDVVRSYKVTPKGASWFIHLAEGTDDTAGAEYQRLKALGCVGSSTVIVHGVGVRQADIEDAMTRVRGLVWCPSSNHYLLGKTAPITAYTAYGWARGGFDIALGSDSRLTADGDLLSEMQAANQTSRCDFDCVMQAVTYRAARILNLPDAGHLNPGAWGDFFAIRELKAYWKRADLALVVRGGVPQFGDPDVMARFPHVRSVPAVLDGAPKALNAALAAQVRRCALREPGLELR